jgi:hypothetical protein
MGKMTKKREAELAIRKMEKIDREIDAGKRKLYTLDEVLKKAGMLVSKSKLTEKDALEIGRKINRAVAKRCAKKAGKTRATASLA